MVPTPHATPSRRAFCLCCIASTALAAGGTLLDPREVFAQARGIVDAMRAAAADAPITVHRLRNGFSVLEGSGGNIGVLSASEGTMLVDAGITASRPRIAEALAALGGKPLSHLINTHWHFDHTDGNEWLHGAGATILAHENTRRHLIAAQRVEDWDFDFPAAPPEAVPTVIVAGDEATELDGASIALRYHPAAHTDGDLAATFPAADIVHAGDIYWNGIYPFIDHSTGGTIDGTIAAADVILTATDADTIVIPGHGNPVSNRAELGAYRDMLVAVRENVAALKRQGRTLDEVVAARPTADFDERWGQFVIGPAFFTKLVYQTI